MRYSRSVAGDPELVQIVDAALAEAVRKAGVWLVCRPGCMECCLGPFPITQLDAGRLREGLAELERREPGRAAQVRRRAREYVARAADAGDEPCPVLDPLTGTCDLYSARPITCRVFGPPIRNGTNALGVCELCFHGASDAQIAACEVQVDADNLESTLLHELERATGKRGETMVAFALL